MRWDMFEGGGKAEKKLRRARHNIPFLVPQRLDKGRNDLINGLRRKELG